MTELHPADYIPEVRCALCGRPEWEMGDWTAELFAPRDPERADAVRPVCQTCRKEYFG